jgi:hypothetical protein
MTDDWIMPEPSLDEDDRFQVAMVGGDVITLLFGGKQKEVATFGILGPSGMGCITCGGRPTWVAEATDVNTTRTLFCDEHRTMGAAELAVKIARTVDLPPRPVP